MLCTWATQHSRNLSHHLYLFAAVQCNHWTCCLVWQGNPAGGVTMSSLSMSWPRFFNACLLYWSNWLNCSILLLTTPMSSSSMSRPQFLMLACYLKQIDWIVSYWYWPHPCEPWVTSDCYNIMWLLSCCPQVLCSSRIWKTLHLMDNDILDPHDNFNTHLLFSSTFCQCVQNTGIKHHVILCLAQVDGLNIGDCMSFDDGHFD